MSISNALLALAKGERPADALLPPCRLEALGTEYFGEEALIASFRRAPLALSDRREMFEAEGHAALFDGDTALLADLHDSRILRLWRLGPGDLVEAEPAIGIAFDTDLVQARRDISARHEDHPALSAQGFGALSEIGAGIAHGWSAEEGDSAYRTRPFLIRAFSAGEMAIGLFAVHRLGGGTVRSAGFAYLAVRCRVASDGPADITIVRDRAGEAAVAASAWRPRIA